MTVIKEKPLNTEVNIYNILDEMGFEDQCIRAERKLSKYGTKGFEIRDFSFDLVQKFYQTLQEQSQK